MVFHRLHVAFPQVEVTFDIDANGILNVTAADKATGRSQHITITASSGLSEAEIERMRKEAEVNAETDRKRKDLIEVRNRADNTIYTAEKSLKDLGDKVPADVKQQTEDGIRKLRETLNGEDVEAIRRDTDALGETIQKIGSSVYQQTSTEQPKPEGEAGSTPPPSPDGDGSGEDVVDGEFKQV